jgi:hypothetical protein
MNTPMYSYTNIASATTTTVRSGKGVLHGITINKAVASGVITIYDNTAGSGTKIATITEPATLLNSQMQLLYDVCFTTGLTIVTGQADDITVSWLPQ